MRTIHKHTTSTQQNTHNSHSRVPTAPPVTIQTNKQIHHTPYTNILQHSKAKITLSLTMAATITTRGIKTNMRHIHTYIVSRHLATRGNNKILRTPPPHISSSEELLPASLVAPLPNSEQIYHPSSNQIYIKSTPNHIHHHYALSHTRHTSSLQLHPHTHHFGTPGFVDRPRRCDYTAGQMNEEAG